ncbi:MAG: hypothetical protein WCK59_01845 [Candidatus Falkowbacteria bacterium]
MKQGMHLLLVILLITSYVQAKETAPKTIEGVVSRVEPQIIGDTMIYFMIEGRREIFSIDQRMCSEANFISPWNKVRISFPPPQRGQKTISCKTFEILEIIHLEK